MHSNGNIKIRPLKTLVEMDAVVALQRTVWDDPTTVIYRNVLISWVRNGGVLLGALDDDRIVGFVLGYLGTESQDSSRPAMANLKLVSQRMAVLPEYRDRGIGYQLKLAQRQYAIQQGIRLITWTFDPLESRNAHLNIHKLGAIVRRYWRDYYGTEPSSQVVLGSSDRLIVEWWVTNHRVEQRITGKRSGLTLRQYTDANATIMNPSRAETGSYPQPGELTTRTPGMVALIEIPGDFDAIVNNDPDLARAWRQHSRELLENALASGYTITDFVYGESEGRMRSFYALTLSEAPLSRFSSN
jgi:predicted GNAT superfamily acetyltransferase